MVDREDKMLETLEEILIELKDIRDILMIVLGGKLDAIEASTFNMECELSTLSSEVVNND